MKRNQNNVKYMVLNSEANKIIPLQFSYLRYTTFATRGIRTNCRLILMICKSSKSMYYFRHETQSNQYEIHVFNFRIKQMSFTMCNTP